MSNHSKVYADFPRFDKLDQYSEAIFGVTPQASDYLVLFLASVAAIWFYTRKHFVAVKQRSSLNHASASPRNQSRDVVQVAAESDKNCVVFFGSQSGTAEDYASRIAKEGKSRFGLQTMVADLADYDYDSLDQYPSDKIAIFVLATYGEGEPTDNATSFYEHITRGGSVFSQSLDPPLKRLQFSIFGLGNSSYKNYNAMVKKVAQALIHHGARQISPAGKGDDGKRTLEEDFLDWKEAMWKEVAVLMNLKERSAVYEPAFRIIEQQSSPSTHASEIFLGELDKSADTSNTCYLAPVVHSKQLLSNSDRACLHVELDISGAHMSYDAGDHVAIWPMNSTKEVNQFLCILGIQEKKHHVVRITPVESTARVPFPSPTTYEAIVRYYLEINAPVSRQFVAGLASFAPNRKAKDEMDRLGKEKDYFHSRTATAYYNIARLLYEASDGETWEIPFSMFVEGLHRLKPRYYSISSSPAAHSKTVAITTVVEEHKTPNIGYVFRGVATNYLMALHSTEKEESTDLVNDYEIKGPRDAYENLKVPMRIRQSHFRLPSILSKPIIMIGAGSGIAPFRGFVQERAIQEDKAGSECGTIMLFFGCRHPREDFLYQSEWEEHERRFKGRFQMVTAFSRLKSEKVYVQHRLREYSAQIDKLLQEGAFVYICGDAARMASAVELAFTDIISKQRMISVEASELVIREMKASSQYQEDIW